MSTTTDQVKVKFATIQPPRGKGLPHTLLLKTVEGVEVEFALDDMAVTFLALFTNTAITRLRAEVGEDSEKLHVWNKDGVLETGGDK